MNYMQRKACMQSQINENKHQWDNMTTVWRQDKEEA